MFVTTYKLNNHQPVNKPEVNKPEEKLTFSGTNSNQGMNIVTIEEPYERELSARQREFSRTKSAQRVNLNERVLADKELNRAKRERNLGSIPENHTDQVDAPIDQDDSPTDQVSIDSPTKKDESHNIFEDVELDFGEW